MMKYMPDESFDLISDVGTTIARNPSSLSTLRNPEYASLNDDVKKNTSAVFALS
jgi:hypothetical protein